MLKLRFAAPVRLTDAALSKVAELLVEEGNPDLFLRVAVRPGGCSGFSYEMFFDTDLADDDRLNELEALVTDQTISVRVAVDSMSAAKLEGVMLDYRDGLQGSGFKLENPNAQRSCGCGQSFA